MSIAVLAGFLALAQPRGIARPEGFLAEPKTGRGPGVLVLHPWWGLNGDVKAFCRRLAGAGFVAFAPDLFHGKLAATRAEATALVQAYEAKSGELKAQVLDAAKYLSDHTGGRTIGVVGFSFGAPYALDLSNADPSQVKAVVVYYGTGHDEFGKSKAAYLGHFAAKDEFEPKAGVDGQVALIRRAGRPVTAYTYPGTGHWFSEPGVKGSYNKAAAELAWKRTLRFLRESLVSKS